MSKGLPRILLVLAAFLLAGGGAVHALAFRKALPVIAGSNLPAFYANACKALWLSDATTLIAAGLFYLIVAARPSIASGTAVALVALVPASTAVLIYAFVGNFLPGHILIAASVLAVIAALRFPGSTRTA
jgi:hypothetical protein